MLEQGVAILLLENIWDSANCVGTSSEGGLILRSRPSRTAFSLSSTVLDWVGRRNPGMAAADKNELLEPPPSIKGAGDPWDLFDGRNINIDDLSAVSSTGDWERGARSGTKWRRSSQSRRGRKLGFLKESSAVLQWEGIAVTVAASWEESGQVGLEGKEVLSEGRTSGGAGGTLSTNEPERDKATMTLYFDAGKTYWNYWTPYQ